MRIERSVLIGFFCFSLALKAQLPKDIPTKGLMGFWSFSGHANDESPNKYLGVVHEATLTTDRFENKNCAYSFNGFSSFISTNYEGILGSHARAVSFWMKTSDKKPTPMIAWGSNSLHPDKGTRFDCGLNYKGEGATMDISDAAITYETHSEVCDGKWHHYVFQFSIPSLKAAEIYQDGVVLSHENFKFYPYTYINTIHSYNVQFGRLVYDPPHPYFFAGELDDIAIYNHALSEQEIIALFHAPNPTPDISKMIIKWLLIILGIAIIIMLVRFYIKLHVKSVLRLEMERTHLRNNAYEQQNKVLKAQMDPHFIFNSLNTIQQFIITNDNEKAQHYLYKFSRLMRQMIESNVKDSISLEDEIELFEKYLEIETLRFDNIFNYNITVPEGKDLSEIFIPHFLVQPFIENAIWHALLPKPGHKQIEISFKIIDEKTLSCTIDDNGVGRKNHLEKTDGRKKKSLAIDFIKQRLELMSKIYDSVYQLVIIDKVNDEGESEGTTVVITMPII